MPWYTREGADVLRLGNVGAVLLYYRTFYRFTQAQLSERIGVDRSYISHFEHQKRRLDGISDRTRLADQLGIPNSFLGIDGAGQQDHRELLERNESVVRLAVVAREEGRPADALRELDLLVAALEDRGHRGKATREDMISLATARAEAGAALGDLLPEAHLTSAAQWTGSGAKVMDRLEGEPRRSAHILRMYGNELRKAGKLNEAVATLQRACEVSPDLGGQAAASLLLARAASETGNATLLDQCIEQCWRAIEQDPEISNFFINPFSLREVELRGLLLTARNKDAERVASRATAWGTPPPTWGVMERVTMAQFHLTTGETDTAASELRTAIHDAQALRLPHQVECAVRLAQSANLEDLVHTGTEALKATSALPLPRRSDDRS